MPSLQAALKSPALVLLLLAGSGLLATAALGLAQEKVEQNEPGATEIRAFRNRASTLLSSDEKRDQAWGAWYMAQHHFADLSAVAEGALAKELARGKEAEGFLLSALIDGLIQNRCKPRLELLSAIWNRDYRDEAMAMAAADTGNARLFLASLLDVEMGQAEHMAACNLLSRETPRLFVDIVLPRIQQLALTVEVGPPLDHGHMGGRRAGTRHGDGVVKRDVDLPPRVFYELSLHPSEGEVVLARGPQTVYLERKVYWKTQGFGSSRRPMTGSDAREYWRDCLVLLADDVWHGRYDERPQKLRWDDKIRIPWTDLAALRTSILSAQAEMRAPWLDLCQNLRRKELLPAGADVDKLFPVKVTLVDDRTVKDGPLPKVDDLLDKDVPPRK